MEFKSLKNIESSFRQIRMIALVFLVLCTLVAGYSIWSSYSFAQKQREKIYVLDNGKSLMLALSQDLSQNRPVEAKEHVKRFHELFFTLSPDKDAIEGNIRRALFLCDESAFRYYKDWSEKGYYNRIISANINQTLQVDSMACDFDRYPYQVTMYARQMIIRASNVTERSLVTRCGLINSVRSDNNPHGFTMERFEILENKDLRDGLRRMCGRLMPGKQLAVTLTMLLGFSALSIYFTVSGIYRMGKEEGERLQIEHIEQMKLHQQADSVPYPVRESSGSSNVIK